MKLLQRRESPVTLGQSRSRALRRRKRWLALGLATAGVAGLAMLITHKSPIAPPVDRDTSYAHAKTPKVNCATQPPAALQSALTEIAAGFEGKVGIAITQAGCDWLAGVRSDAYFPQQSVSKLWVALSLLDAVDRGKMRLDEPLTLRPQDQVVFNQPLRWTVLEQGSLTLPAVSLMQDALSLSDNMANDKLLWRVGGPDRVRQVLAMRKLDGIRFGPGERLLQSAIAGVTWTPALAQGYAFDQARARIPTETRSVLLAKYLADPMDGATPEGIAKAMGRLGAGALLSDRSTAVLLGILAHSRSGPLRLKGGLPRDWKAYHKTGTGQELRGTQTGFNDVALIEAPDGTRYGVAVMIGETRLTNRDRLDMMQSVSRALVASHEAARGGQLQVPPARAARPSIAAAR